MHRNTIVILAGLSLWLLDGTPAVAQSYGTQAQVDVAKALKDAKVSLQDGLAASQPHGTPISATFELEYGKLELSVYTMKGDQFAEVIVDPMTGKVVETEAITEGEDLTEAEAQRDVMARATKPLRAVVDAAVQANAGARAISVVPALRDGHPVAKITLANGETVTTVPEKLD